MTSAFVTITTRNDANSYEHFAAKKVLDLILNEHERHSLFDYQDGAEIGLSRASLYVFDAPNVADFEGTHVCKIVTDRGAYKAKVEVIVYPDEVSDPLAEFERLKKDLRIDRYRVGSFYNDPGPHSRNCVRITHMPSGTEVNSQSERTFEQNFEYAIRLLVAKLNHKSKSVTILSTHEWSYE